MKRFALGFGLLLASAVAAYAAVTGNNFITAQTPNRGIAQFLQGTDTAGVYKTLYTAGANGSKCYGGYITSNDATSHLVTIQIVNAAVKYGGMSINTGTTLPGFANAVPPIAFMSSANWPGLPVDSSGNPYILLANGDTLQATFATALTASDFVNIVIVCSDF